MGNMKIANKFISFIWLLMIMLSGCQYGENVICNRAPLYNKGFDMPNLITILNPKDTFNLNDTLFLRAEFPVSFYGDKKSCSYNVNSLEVDPTINVFYNTKEPTNLLGVLPIIPKIGFYDLNKPVLYTFKLQNNNYKAEMGFILNDTSINSIGIDTSLNEWNQLYGIRFASNLNTGCTYDDDNCAVGKKRHPYELGFYINTSFQGGIKRWKINMRK